MIEIIRAELRKGTHSPGVRILGGLPGRGIQAKSGSMSNFLWFSSLHLLHPAGGSSRPIQMTHTSPFLSSSAAIISDQALITSCLEVPLRLLTCLFAPSLYLLHPYFGLASLPCNVTPESFIPASLPLIFIEHLLCANHHSVHWGCGVEQDRWRRPLPPWNLHTSF